MSQDWIYAGSFDLLEGMSSKTGKPYEYWQLTDANGTNIGRVFATSELAGKLNRLTEEGEDDCSVLVDFSGKFPEILDIRHSDDKDIIPLRRAEMSSQLSANREQSEQRPRQTEQRQSAPTPNDDGIVKISGKDYKLVAYRINDFRKDHPEGAILTEMVMLEGNLAVFKASVMIHGALVATSYGSADASKLSDKIRFIEKAETAAIGRALGIAGYGTLSAIEEDSDHLADSPQ